MVYADQCAKKACILLMVCFHADTHACDSTSVCKQCLQNALVLQVRGRPHSLDATDLVEGGAG